MFRPHVLPYFHFDPIEPLSIRLRGDEAYHAFVGRMPMENGHERIYAGEEVRDGIRCHRIDFVTHYKTGAANSSKISLWIAESRNYLPVAQETFIHIDKGDVAFDRSAVESFDEIAPGVWIPSRVVIRHYDRFALAKTGELHELYSHVITVNSCQLISAADPKLFSEVVFPDGTAMYEVDATGKILRSWREGVEPVAAPSRKSATVLWVIVVLNLLAVFVVVRFLRPKARV